MKIASSQTNQSVPANGELVLKTIAGPGFCLLYEVVVKLANSTALSLSMRENGVDIFDGPQAVTASFLFNQISGGTLLDGGDTSLKVVTYSVATSEFTIGWEPNAPVMLRTPLEMVVKNSTGTVASVKSWYLVYNDRAGLVN